MKLLDKLKVNVKDKVNVKSKKIVHSLIQDHVNEVLLLKQEMNERKRQITALEQQLAVERAALEAEKRRNLSLQVSNLSR